MAPDESASIHQTPLSRDDFDSEISSGENLTYTVPSPSREFKDQSVSNSMFTGGHNFTTTHTCLTNKVVKSESSSHLQMEGEKGSLCGRCHSEVIVGDECGGIDIVPCKCGYKICRACNDDEVCPGCKEPYAGFKRGVFLERSSTFGMSKREKRLMSANPVLMGENDPGNMFLYESKGSYGYGNAMWMEDGGAGESLEEGIKKPWKPLTRKFSIAASVLVPYRLLILLRMIVLALFLTWRISHPNEDAVWLWAMSITCEIWFAFSWLLDQLPKLCPVNRSTDLDLLKEKFEAPNPDNPTGKSDLPGIDIFVSTADPEKEPPLVTANTILSILASDYPVEKLSCYISDDGGSLVTFEAMAEAASFANLWVPFCRKHNIEPRNPDSYFTLKRDPYKDKVRCDFVKDRRLVRREYDEFKVRINGLIGSIQRRSDALNSKEEIKAMKIRRENIDDDEPALLLKVQTATWMSNFVQWPGTWFVPAPEHSRGDHASIIQIMLKPPSYETSQDSPICSSRIDFSGVDTRLPLFVYVSREKHPGYDHNKKAGAMNGLVRASAVLSNGPFILNLDCDHYIYNSRALREGICFMMDPGGDGICFVQFPQRFEGIDPSDRYANRNTVFFDVGMRALDGLQGPVYVGTGCLFRRIALYGFSPPQPEEHPSCFGSFFSSHKKPASVASAPDDDGEDGEEMSLLPLAPKNFGNSDLLVDSIRESEFQGRPLADHPSVKNGRMPGSLVGCRKLLTMHALAEAINVISCWYEDKTEWGRRIGWIYGSVTEDVLTGYGMHNRGWRSVYCMTKPDAFRGTAPINLTDRLHQVLRWATGSVEIFFSRNNALLGTRRVILLQRIAYLNVGVYPFTSVFLIVYCFLPAICLLSGEFIVQSLDVTFLTYLLAITLTLCALSVLEIKWAGIGLEEWWRNEQFWLIGGTSAHFAAVLQGLLKVVAGIEISFTLTSKSGGDDSGEEFPDLYLVKWTSLMIPPMAIMITNLIGIAVAVSRTVYSEQPEWSRLIGGVFFSLWVLTHLYPFAKGLMGRTGRTPTLVFVWAGLIAIIISLLCVTVQPSSGNGTIQFR